MLVVRVEGEQVMMSQNTKISKRYQLNVSKGYWLGGKGIGLNQREMKGTNQKKEIGVIAQSGRCTVKFVNPDGKVEQKRGHWCNICNHYEVYQKKCAKMGLCEHHHAVLCALVQEQQQAKQQRKVSLLSVMISLKFKGMGEWAKGCSRGQEAKKEREALCLLPVPKAQRV
ncbi:uncharacterized protein BJ212DRAFT_1303353 [Suillus subaureus]|uniref:Uncharacterized protein n=1 Tax=Suillus subaureus TaxID=48587 RepID=A0A9P7J7W7_9AGAM|nr:uncharacterized protein BJ212DRAFT_1303353 [Suillus subaureus]KAG1807635.1 hypothetical protein BJ212DRAFT_1303353 [Suillus subaureus]